MEVPAGLSGRTEAGFQCCSGWLVDRTLSFWSSLPHVPVPCSLVVASSNLRMERSSLCKKIPGGAKLHLNRVSVIKGENTFSYFMFSVLITKALVQVGDTTLCFANEDPKRRR